MGHPLFLLPPPHPLFLLPPPHPLFLLPPHPLLLHVKSRKTLPPPLLLLPRLLWRPATASAAERPPSPSPSWPSSCPPSSAASSRPLPLIHTLNKHSDF